MDIVIGVPAEPIEIYLDFYAEGGSSDMGLDELIDNGYSPTATDYYGLHLYAVQGSGYRWGLSGYSIFGQPGTVNSRHEADLMCSLKGNFWDQFIIDSEDEEQDEEEYGFELENMSSIADNGMYDFSALSGNNMTKFTRDFNPYENHTWLMHFDTKISRNTAYVNYYIKVTYNCYDTELKQNVKLNTGSYKTYVTNGVPGSGRTIFYDDGGDYASMNVYTYTSPQGGIGAIQRGPDIPFTCDGYKLASKYELKSIEVQLTVER